MLLFFIKYLSFNLGQNKQKYARNSDSPARGSDQGRGVNTISAKYIFANITWTGIPVSGESGGIPQDSFKGNEGGIRV